MLRRHDVGHRVVVRRIVGVTHDRPLYSDALGELVDLTETELTIATANGTLRVPLRDVHRAKRVPATRRPPAADVIALELAANDAWPAPVQATLGGWILRAAGNWTDEANSALVIGDPDRMIEPALDAVQQWYSARGQQPLINAPMPLAAPVNAALDERGWSTRPLVLVQTGGVEQLLTEPAARPDLPPVELADSPGDHWLGLQDGVSLLAEAGLASPDRTGSLGDNRAARRDGVYSPTALRLLTAVPDVVFAQVRDADGEVIAAARGTVTGPQRWFGVSLVHVVPGARRQGLAQHVLRAMAQWASQRGSRRGYVQVRERDAAAVALFTRLGFSTHHTYLTRHAPPS